MQIPLIINMELIDEMLEDLQDAAVEFGIILEDTEGTSLKELLATHRLCETSEKLRRVIKILIEKKTK